MNSGLAKKPEKPEKAEENTGKLQDILQNDLLKTAEYRLKRQISGSDNYKISQSC